MLAALEVNPTLGFRGAQKLQAFGIPRAACSDQNLVSVAFRMNVSDPLDRLSQLPVVCYSLAVLGKKLFAAAGVGLHLHAPAVDQAATELPHTRGYMHIRL